jgi:hypothetical protein
MKRKLWPWFMVGFAATFCVLAVVLKSYVMLPSGAAATRVSLWRYYLNELPRIFGTQTLGPASANQDGLIITTLQHCGLAAIGGLVVLAVAWKLQRRRRVPA